MRCISFQLSHSYLSPSNYFGLLSLQSQVNNETGMNILKTKPAKIDNDPNPIQIK